MSAREYIGPLFDAARARAARDDGMGRAGGRGGDGDAVAAAAGSAGRASLPERFAKFHHDNPHVLETLIELSDKVRALGIKHWGMARLFEKLRWDHAIATMSDDFMLNDNYAAFYVRLIEARRPDLAGFFLKRVSLADNDPGVTA
jgi:hypothetical protein